jgi:hypothetical protein
MRIQFSNNWHNEYYDKMRFGGRLMDKRKVIHAYHRGLLTMQECAQLLGIDSIQMIGAVEDQVVERRLPASQQTVIS